MINRNKLYSNIFSIVFIYTVMTSFELIFYALVVSPVITSNIRNLLNSYKSKKPVQFNFDPNPRLVVNILNTREYQLINGFNLNSYLIIVVFIALLISLLLFLYNKIAFIEKIENTDTPNVSPIGSNVSVNRSTSEDHLVIGTSQNSNITRRNTKKFLYLKHAIWCGVSTIACLIIYQIFFYNYGLSFKYVGTSNEIIVLFVESIQN